MVKFNEDTLSELPAIEQLKRLGYKYLHGDHLDPELNRHCERQSRRDVILTTRLKEKLSEINTHLTEESIDKAIRKITHIQAENTPEANRIFHQYITSGISIDQDIGAHRQKQTVNFIDFDNISKNEFFAVNQFWVRGTNVPDRPDIVIFINGIPIVVIECKSPVAKNKGVIDAKIQLIRYQTEIPYLFRTNAFLIGCNLFGAEYGTIDVPLEQFHEWKELGDEKLPNMAEHPTVKEMLRLGLIDKDDLSEHPTMQEILIAGLLKKENLLDIIRNFIVFDYSKEEHKAVKKICRYKQFTAVNKIVRRVKEEPFKRGIIWHWQGSGKSLIMVFTAIKLKREEKRLGNPVILVVTDRNKLDIQITEAFQNCNFPNPIQAKNMKQLYELLGSGTGNTIMTTVQKFRKPLEKPLSLAENVIVLTDEAHRTQYGSFALNVRNALPNASFFAFTGTPLNKRDRNTYRHFSPPHEKYLDKYDIKQSLEDETTVPIKYESRMAKLQVVGASMDVLLRELFPEKTLEEILEIKSRYVTVDTIMSAPRRIERIAKDIVDHYIDRIMPNGLKAMIVAKDRDTAIMYKDVLDKLIDKSWSTVVISVNNDDPKEWKDKYRRTAKEEDYLTGKEVFQNPADPLKFLIVCDKLMTGFDTPILQVMYLDQRMKEHTLLQAVARTNRKYTRKGYGLIVDYAGVGKELTEALSIFDEKDLEGFFSVDDIKEELFLLQETRKKLMAFFHKINLSGEPKDVLQKCLEILKPEDVRAEFDKLFLECAKSMDILMPDPCVNPYVRDFKFWGMVREGAKNLYRDERLSLENCSKKIENLIHAHISDLGIEEILEPINITAPDFEEKLEIKGSIKAKASHIEQAIRETITANIGEDPRHYQSLQKQLELIIEEDKKRRLDEAELLKRLVNIGKQEESRETLAKSLGLTISEYAFYGLLESYKDNVFNGSSQKMCTVTKKIVQVIEDRKVIDWIHKEDVQKEMRREIKDLLYRINFPEDKMEPFIRELVELAKNKYGY